MNKQILRLAIPNILSNVTVPLLSSVDTAVLGHLESTVYLGAIALGSMIFNFLYWGLGFLRMGTTGVTAQAWGANKNIDIATILYRSLSIALLLALFLLIFQTPIAKISFILIDGSKEVEFFAQKYFYIRIIASPATLALFSIHGWLLGVQNSKYPLYIALFVNILNIILNFYFVYGLNLNIEGVAWATVISQYSGIVFSSLLIYKKYKSIINNFLLRKIFLKSELISFFKINTDIFIRTLLIIFSISFFTAKSASTSDDVLAANFILLQLWLIISYGVDGFAFAAESLSGKYYGARDLINLKEVIKVSQIWGLILGISISAVYFIFGKEIISIYTSQENVIAIAMVYIYWVVLAPVINSLSFIWDGIFLGVTATREMLYSMIVSVLIFYIPVYYLSVNLIGNHALWLAITSFILVRGISLTIMYKTRILKLFYR